MTISNKTVIYNFHEDFIQCLKLFLHIWLFSCKDLKHINVIYYKFC